MKPCPLKMTASLRWAFNFTNWKPTQSEWTFAAQCIQPEEKQRISQFMFQKDAKAAMCGRLLIRKYLSDHLKIPYDLLIVNRTTKGKPFFNRLNSYETTPSSSSSFPSSSFSSSRPPPPLSPYFNVAHNGDFVVLAAEPQNEVGIDIMKIESPTGRSLTTFFHNMRRQFTEREWKLIKTQPTERLQLEMFFRHWCLKESVVKSLGEGISFGLDRLEFQVRSFPLENDRITRDTIFYLDGKVNPLWTFEESLLNSDHCVVVGYQTSSILGANTNEQKIYPTSASETHSQNENEFKEKTFSHQTPSNQHFKILSWNEVISGSIPQSDADKDFWLNFDSKSNQPF